LRATGAKLSTANPLQTGTHTRGYLPHVKRENAAYFVTFRLVDSLPRQILLRFQQERAEKMRLCLADGRIAKPKSKQSLDSEIEREYYRKVERHLDQGNGSSYLKQPEIGELVANAIRHFDGERYLLRAWVVMPNHVHAVLWPMPNHKLSAILRTWKGFTAQRANQILNRSGQIFWQRESFDHWIRDEEENERICRYVINNPVKAGLCKRQEEWRWSSAQLKGA
jgi:REP element-mobilizing transposase RayT